MGDFFHSWRRKLGCFLLVMASVTTGMWIRSMAYGDWLRTGANGKRTQFIASFQGGLKWIESTDDSGGIRSPRFRVSMTERYKTDETLMPIFGGGVIVYEWQWRRFGMLMAAGTAAPQGFSVLLIPYWWVVSPLTLLSTYLILWPGKRSSKTPQPGKQAD